MAQVSRRKMNEGVEQKIFSLFSEVLVSLNKKEEVENFLVDLLSPSERTMLTKRLSIAFLLSRGYNYEEICAISGKIPGYRRENVLIAYFHSGPDLRIYLENRIYGSGSEVSAHVEISFQERIEFS